MTTTGDRSSIIERIRREHEATRPATIVSDDARTQAVIREAEETRRREEAAGPLDEREFLKTFGAKDVADPVFAAVQFLNGPPIVGRIVPGGRFQDDYVSRSMNRHDLAFWRERFDLVAERLGYRKVR